MISKDNDRTFNVAQASLIIGVAANQLLSLIDNWELALLHVIRLERLNVARRFVRKDFNKWEGGPIQSLQKRCKPMPTTKLTDNFLRGVERPSSGAIRHWDTDIKGFVAHVQKTTTTLYYDRNNQRHLIGRFPTVTMPQARETARELDYRRRRGYAKQEPQCRNRSVHARRRRTA